jgi:hypothetical protein
VTIASISCPQRAPAHAVRRERAPPDGPPVRRPLLGRSRSQEAVATLWEVSERETGVGFDLAARP